MMEFGESTVQYVAAVFVFLAGLTFAEALLTAGASRRDVRQKKAARERLKRHATRIQRPTEEDQSIVVNQTTRGPILTFLASLIPDRQRLDVWIYQAGVPMQLEGLLGVSLLLAIVGFFVANAFVGIPGWALLGVLVGGVPSLYVGHKRRKRMEAFTQAFPDAIDLLCRSLKSGHPLNTALRLVADEVEEPIASELSQVVDEIGMGLDLRIALQNLGRRIRTSEMPFFINALLIQRETGGDLPRVLSSLSETARERIQFRQKVDAVVAQTRTSANVLAVLPFAFIGLMSAVNPEYLKPLFEPGTGYLTLFSAFALTVVGYTLCRALVRIDV